MEEQKNNLTHKITFRLTAGEYGAWMQASNMTGRRMSDLIRATLQGRKIIIIENSESLKNAVRDQARIGNLLVKLDKEFGELMTQKMRSGEININELRTLGQALRSSRDQLHNDLLLIRKEIVQLRQAVDKAQRPGGRKE